ncbi:MAG: hypothetical protein J6Z18_09110 [Prevotella sp.]|nr:hypothetical protein [Prevotella sp.]
MNRLEIYKTLRKHVKLSEKRNVNYEQNKTAKYVIYFFSGFMLIYLIFIAIMMSLIANEQSFSTRAEFFFGLLPFILTVDFLVRFLAQQTPAQLVKPYLLLNIPRYACVESFILSAMMSTNNLLWLFISVPYVIMSVLFSYGFWSCIGFVIGFQLLIIVNSLNYMLWRTMILRNILWWIAPIIIYGSMFLPWIITGDFDNMFDIFAPIGEAFARGNILAFLGALILLYIFFLINRKVQYHYTMVDTTMSKDTSMKSVTEIHQLDRFGIIGEYIKLEVKSIMRNKNIRNTFIFSVIFTVILSLVISFTDVYSDSFSNKFWIVYVFILMGARALCSGLGAEGNYIDLLMTHKENILQLLHAKYFFYSAMNILPFIIMIPTICMGKYSLLAVVAMLCFSIGPVYCVFMQMAVWNKQTTPLNSKLVNKGNVESNWFAVAAEMGAMFGPVILLFIFGTFLSENMTYLIMLLIGLIFIACRKLWMRNIYQRLMARRYVNMESFRATRP